MTHTNEDPNVDLGQRSDRQRALVATKSETLRASTALNLPKCALRNAITVLSVTTLMNLGPVPASAGSGDTFVNELASDAASEPGHERETTGNNPPTAAGVPDGTNQNRADKASRGSGPVDTRQNDRARDAIMDAVKRIYLDTGGGVKTAEDAARTQNAASQPDNALKQGQTFVGSSGAIGEYIPIGALTLSAPSAFEEGAAYLSGNSATETGDGFIAGNTDLDAGEAIVPGNTVMEVGDVLGFRIPSDD